MARRVWLAALDDDDSTDAHLARRHDDLRRLISTQAQQIAEDFRAARRTAGDGRD